MHVFLRNFRARVCFWVGISFGIGFWFLVFWFFGFIGFDISQMNHSKLTEKNILHLENADFRTLSRTQLTCNQWYAFYNGMKRTWSSNYPHWRDSETTYLWFNRASRKIRSKWCQPLYTDYSSRNVSTRDFDSTNIFRSHKNSDITLFTAK